MGQNLIVLVVGLGITIFGALIWAFKRTERRAENKIDFLGLHLTLNTPALAVMFVGVILVLVSLMQVTPAPDPKPSATSADQPAEYPEMDATRTHSFEFTTPPTEVKAGLRKWTRVAPDVWEQVYPDGTKEYSYTLKRIHLDSCDGTIVVNKNDLDFQAYVPDRNCDDREFMFRRLSQGPGWRRYVPIDAMK